MSPSTGDNDLGTPGQMYIGVLENRISTLDRQQRELAQDIGNLGSQMERSLKAAVDSFGRQMDALSSKVDERSKIPWPALGVMLSFITVIGGLVWYPVKYNQDKLEAAVVRIADSAVNKTELENRLGTAAQRRDDFQRATDSRIDSLQRQEDVMDQKIVPLDWHKDKWAANERELGNLRDTAQRSENNLQRQLDEVKRSFGDTFSLRDALQTMQRRLDSLETFQSSARGRAAGG
jgi:DNA repair exonuclease SbcCD ATPase subunit